MRQSFSFVGLSSTYVLDETVNFDDPAFVRVKEALVITMGANPECLTRHEASALRGFIGWFNRCKLESGTDSCVTMPVFSHHNLSEGHSMVVIWTDVKGKLVLPID